MAGVDINRTTAGILLPPEVSSEIWASAQEQSFIMQRAQRTPLPGAGKSFQTITGDGQAAFVGETERKPLSNPTFGTKTMRAHKIALTHSFSDEFRRDKAALFNALKPRMSGDIARTFDLAALHGVGAPTADFDNLSDAPSGALSDPVYDQFVAALQSVSAAGGDVTGWGLSGQAEGQVLLAKDTTGRPIFTGNAQNDGSVGSILGRPVWRSRNIYNDDTVGIGGDWASAMWGSVEGISYEEYGGPIYTSSGTLVHAGRQDNMFSVICEIEVGFIVRDINRFYRLTGATEGDGGDGE